MDAEKNRVSVIGKTLAHYQVVEKIGEGGMGQVYRAVDSTLGRDIALKVLPLEAAVQPDRRDRFEREARSLAALSHPNIVTIHSVEEADGVRFLTMELVRGRTLDQVTPERGLPLDRFFDIAVTLADALSSAHRKGITHRDLKPTNIMIDDQGRLKILDFGLVKLLEPESVDQTATRTAGREDTQEGRILGTAAYMSPEQAEGKAIDHRSDIFSLGVVLYEALTGRRPFEGDTQMSTLSAIIREEPKSVTEMRERLPRQLERIIRRCLQKDVERRFQSALDLRNDLQELRDEIASGELEPPAGGLPTSGGRRWLLPVLGAVAIIVLIYVAVRLVGTANRSPVLQRGAPVQALVTNSGLVHSGSISPDGNYVVFSTLESGQSNLYVKQLATGSEVRIVSSGETVVGSAVSPDGQYVLYQAQPVGSNVRDLYRIPLLGGTPRRVLEGVIGGFALAPDDGRIAFFRPGEALDTAALRVAGSDGSAERELATVDTGGFRPFVAWSPTGNSLLANRFVSEAEPGAGHGAFLTEIDAADGTLRRTGSHRWTVLAGLRWRADGRIFLAGIGGSERYQDPVQLWQQDSLGAEPRLLLSDLAEYTDVSLDGAGSTLASVAETFDQTIWVLQEADPERPRKIDYTQRVGRWYVRVAWTPDSKRLLVEHREGDDMHIRALPSDGGESELLTTQGPFNMGPTVAPAGDRFAFFSNRSGTMKIYIADISGAHAKRLTEDDWEEFFPRFGPQGKWIYYHSREEGDRWRLRRVPVDGGPSELLSDESLVDPEVSPDGQRVLAFHDDGVHPPRLVLVPLNGSAPVFLDLDFLKSHVDSVTWDPDGAALTCARRDGSGSSVWVVPLDGSEPGKLASFPDVRIRSLAWNASGDTLAVVTSRRSGDVVLVKGL